ncbi:MAG: hypothetical protein AAF871_08665 [Pseudomonadota bacterium]
MRRATLAFGLMTSIALPALAGQGPWELLAAVEIDEVGDGDAWQAIKTFPPELVAARDGFLISGYAVPVTPEPYVQTFMLVEDQANCPFCGGDTYGPVLEVHLKRPAGDLKDFDAVTVSGQLELIEDTGTYQSYRLVDAVIR